jgi:hypothetical protein
MTVQVHMQANVSAEHTGIFGKRVALQRLLVVDREFAAGALNEAAQIVRDAVQTSRAHMRVDGDRA